MTYKNKILLLITIAIFFTGIGYGLINFIKVEFDTCGTGYNNIGSLSEKINLTPSCGGYRGYLASIDINLGVPLLLFSLVSVFILVIFLFLREQIFHTWSKFAIIFLPVAIIFVAVVPEYRDVFFSFGKEAYSLFFAVIFSIVSLFIIAVNSYKLRGK